MITWTTTGKSGGYPNGHDMEIVACTYLHLQLGENYPWASKQPPTLVTKGPSRVDAGVPLVVWYRHEKSSVVGTLNPKP